MQTIRTLANGIQLFVLPNPSIQTMVAMVGVKVGSRYEIPELHGAAHFVEHMMFKGTKRFPNSKAISEVIDARGGEHNAYTDKEQTNFYVRMAKPWGDVAVDLVHELISESLFRDSDVEKERPVIQEEITGYENNPDHSVWMLSDQVLFEGTGLAHSIAGTVDSVTFSSEALRTFFRSYYVPSRMAVALAGAVSEDLVDQAVRKFEKLPGEFTGQNHAAAPGFRGGFAFAEGNTDKLHVAIRMPGVPYGSKDSKTVSVLAAILGGFMSARLFQSIRDEHGLCYGIGSAPLEFSDTGSLIVYTALERKNFPKAMSLLFHELKKLAAEGVTDQELQNVKTYVQGSKFMVMDKPMAVASDAIAQHFMTGRYETPEEELKGYQALSLDQINSWAKANISPTPETMHVAVVGPEGVGDEVRIAYESAFS